MFVKKGIQYEKHFIDFFLLILKLIKIFVLHIDTDRRKSSCNNFFPSYTKTP